MYRTLTYDMFEWRYTTTSGVQVRPPKTEGDQPQLEEIEMDTFCFLNSDIAAEHGVYEETRLAFGSKERLAQFIAFASQHLDGDGRKLVRDTMQLSSGIVPVAPEVALPPGIERR